MSLRHLKQITEDTCCIFNNGPPKIVDNLAAIFSLWDTFEINILILHTLKKLYSGFVDHGPLEAKEIIASEALVFQLVGLRSHWKQLIGYFLIDKMSAATQASLVNMALIMASNAGLILVCYM